MRQWGRRAGLSGRRRLKKCCFQIRLATGALARVGFAALTMKAKIHPEYVDAVIHCACGNILKDAFHAERTCVSASCSKCHPFFTGTQKFIDTAGRVERFQKRYAKKSKLAAFF